MGSDLLILLSPLSIVIRLLTHNTNVYYLYKYRYTYSFLYFSFCLLQFVSCSLNISVKKKHFGFHPGIRMITGNWSGMLGSWDQMVSSFYIYFMTFIFYSAWKLLKYANISMVIYRYCKLNITVGMTLENLLLFNFGKFRTS